MKYMPISVKLNNERAASDRLIACASRWNLQHCSNLATTSSRRFSSAAAQSSFIFSRAALKLIPRISCTTVACAFTNHLSKHRGNSFFIDTIKRVNRVRRLLSYRSMQHRERYVEHCKQHLHVLDLLKRERNEEASDELRQHLLHTLDALSRISGILKP
jgi:hypothetical protein